MFERWLYSPRNYVMAILLVLGVYALALEELSYSIMGQLISAKIVRIQTEETDRGPAHSKQTFTWATYEFTDSSLSETVSDRMQAPHLKVGDTVELQYIPGWRTWHRMATSRKPWLGWVILAGSIVIFIVSFTLAKESKDPFAKAKEMRYRN